MKNAAIRNRQTENAECGLAALGMAVSMLGSQIDLAWLRQRFPPSTRGATFKSLADVAGAIGLSARPVRCDIAQLAQLGRPAILHWNLNHFVVLDRLTSKGVRIFDPAHGYATYPMSEVSKRFSGVALELSSTPAFQRRAEQSSLRLSALLNWTGPIKSALGQALVLSLLLQCYVIASPFYMQLAIDEAALKGDVDLLLILAIGFAVFAVFNAGAEALRGVVLQRLTLLLNWDMTHRLFHHMIRLPLTWFQRRRLADAQSRFQALDPIRNLIANGLVGTLIDGLLSVVTAVMMFIYAPSLALITLAGLVIYMTLRSVAIPISRRYATDALLASIAEQGKRLETLRAMQTIKVMGGESQRESDWSNSFAETVTTAQTSALVGMGFSTVQKLLDAIATVIVVYIGVTLIIKGQMTIGVLYAFIAYRTQFMSRAISLFEQAVNWRLLDIYTFRIADVVHTSAEAGLDITPAGLPEMIGCIEIDEVSYAYSSTEPAVLDKVSMTIKAGEFVAITGPSGVGKSTLLKILCGLYPTTAGEIRIDGIPLRLWGPKALRSAIGVVMQDDELLPGSIADNISFFDDRADHGHIWDCLRVASMDEDVRKMPMRLDTLVGDLGLSFSGGQKQRILLARALYKRPKILILDEATSHLDLSREKHVNDGLAALKITRVIVAHRPETINIADRVLTLNPPAHGARRSAPKEEPHLG